jgi:hypothetical protein
MAGQVLLVVVLPLQIGLPPDIETFSIATLDPGIV